MILIQYGKRKRLIITSDLVLEPGQWPNSKTESLGLVIFREPVTDKVELFSKAFNVSKREVRQNLESFKPMNDVVNGRILQLALDRIIAHWVIE